MSTSRNNPPPAKPQFTLRGLLMAIYIICLVTALAVQEEMLVAFVVFALGMLAFVAFCLATSQNKAAIISSIVLASGVFFFITGYSTGIILDRSACLMNAKQLGIALLNYNDRHTSLPARVRTTVEGEPGLSWRVDVLPFVDFNPLHKRFELDEPWDSTNNLPLAKERPYVYRCPAGKQRDDTISYYYAVGGPDSCFPDGAPVSLNDITKADGASNTLLVVESHDVKAVWSEPRDLDPATMSWTINQPSGISSPHAGGAMASFADGSTRLLSKNIDPAVLKQLANRRDGKPANNWEP